MRKRIFARLVAGLLCGALLFTDATLLDVWAVSNDPNVGQIASLEELATTEETDEEEAENPNQEADEPEGDDAAVIEGDAEAEMPVEKEKESVSEEEQPSVSENAVEEEQDSDSENTTEEEANVNLVMTASEEEPIAQGTSNNISWVIDADGKLTVTGNGDWENKTVDSYRWTPWYDNRESIITAKINVTGMTDASYMFIDCHNLTDIDLRNFDTDSVTNMSSMFRACRSLTTLDVSNFNTDNVTDMSCMFLACISLTTLNISNFNTDNVTDMRDMFNGCNSLTTLDVSNFNTDNVTNMYCMFEGCWDLTSLDLSSFNTDNVTNMYCMFEGCWDLTSLDLSSFNTENVEYMFGMFNGCYSLTTIYTPRNVKQSVELPYLEEGAIWCHDDTVVSELPKNLTYSVTLRKHALRSGTSNNISWVIDVNWKLTVSGTGDFEKIDIGYGRMRAPWGGYNMWIKTAEINVTGMSDASYMFSGCQDLADIDLRNFDTSSVTDMSNMFEHCENLTTLDLSNFDTNSVTDMSFMFYSCHSLTELDLSNFNTGNVTDMWDMFYGCHSLTELDLNSFNTSSVTNMSGMFGYCENLTTLDLSIFDAGNVMEMYGMLNNCSNLTAIYTPRNVTQYVDLPSEPGDKWYRSDGTVVTELPRSLNYSVALGRNYTPTDKNPDDPSDDDPKNDDSVLPEDIPEDGVIPNGLWIAKISDHTYTGAAIKPEVHVYESRTRLKQGEDYTLSYQNTTNAAQVDDVKPPTVVMKGKGNYSGTETKTFTIKKRDISDTYVTKSFADAYTPLANGKNPTLVFSAKCNNKALKKNTDYTLTVKDSSGNEVPSYAAVGTYTAVVKGVGTNYAGEYSFPFEVLNKVPVTKLKIGKIASVNYDGTSKTPEPVIKYGKVTLNKEKDYTLNYQNNTAIGTATIEITGMGDYFGIRKVTFSITGLQIKKAKFTGFQTSFPYTGGEVSQTAIVLKYEDEELKEGRDYTVSYSNHRNKGKATVTYTGIGKYTGTIKKTYTITAYNIKTDAQKRIKLSTDTISAVYAKGGAKSSLKVYDGARLLTEGKDYTLSYQNNTAVTTSATKKQPTITVKGKGNYTGAFSEKKTFTITAKDIAEVTVTAPDVASSTKVGKYKSTPVLTDTTGKKLKAGTDYDKAYTYTYKSTTEKVLNNGAEVTRNAGDPVDAKDIVPVNTMLCVRIQAKEGSNYTGETTVEYRIVSSLISKAKITVQNPAQNNKNLFSYTGQAILLDKSSLIVKVGTEVLSGDQYEILEDTYKNNVSKGTASVQIRGVGNYGGTATVKFKIGTKSFQWVKRLFG